MATIKLRGENELFQINEKTAEDLRNLKKTEKANFTVDVELGNMLKTIELGKIYDITTMQDKKDKRKINSFNNDKRDEVKDNYEATRLLTPEQKFKKDLSRLKVILKILGFNLEEEPDKYKAFYVQSLEYFKEFPNRTRVGGAVWDIFGDEKGQIIKQKFTPSQKRVFKLFAQDCVEDDIIMAYNYEIKKT